MDPSALMSEAPPAMTSDSNASDAPQISPEQLAQAQRLQAAYQSSGLAPQQSTEPQMSVQPQQAPQAPPMPTAETHGIPPPPQAMRPLGTVTERAQHTISGTKSSPELIKKLDTAVKQQKSAEVSIAEAQAKQAAEDAGYVQKFQETQQVQQEKDQARLQADQQATDAQFKKTQDLVEEFNNLPAVDPRRYEKSRGLAGNIAGVIGVALGAFGAALTKTPNYALEMYNKAVEQDIDAQKSEYEKKGHLVNQQNNLYAQLRQKGLDDSQAQLTQRQISNDMLKNQLMLSAAKAKSPEIMANADKFVSLIDQSTTLTKNKLYQESQPKVGQDISEKTAPLVEKDAALSHQIEKDDRERSVPIIGEQTDEKGHKLKDDDGNPVLAPVGEGLAKTPHAAEQLREAGENRIQLNKLINQIRHITKTSNFKLAGSDAQQLNGLRAEFRALYVKGQEGVNRITSPELQIAADQLADPTSLITRDGSVFKSLDRVQGAINVGYFDKLKAQGVTKK